MKSNDRSTTTSARPSAPVDDYEILVTFSRSNGDAELRVSIGQYEGHRFLSMREWTRGSDGSWWPSKKGATIRVAEIADFKHAVEVACSRIGAE